jgi:CheY-like chemotaxis protein
VKAHEHAILIVEDHADTRDAMSELLALDGYRVVAVPDVAGGLAALRSCGDFCFILLDYHLPEKNGLDFRAQQILNPEWRRIPTALCTADSRGRELALELGLVHVFTKPVQPMAVVWLVEQYCPAAVA